MVLEAKPRAVIRGEDDERVFCEFAFAQGGHQSTYLMVDMFDDVAVGVFGVWVANLIWNIKRDMRHGMGKIEKKGLLGFG